MELKADFETFNDSLDIMAFGFLLDIAITKMDKSHTGVPNRAAVNTSKNSNDSHSPKCGLIPEKSIFVEYVIAIRAPIE